MSAASRNPRTPLPMAAPAGPHGTRSRATCVYRCAMACYHPAPNRSDNAYLGDIVELAVSRRSMLAGAAALATVPLVAAPSAAGGPVAAARSAPRGLAFTPVAPVASTVDSFVVPAGYTWAPVVTYLDPLVRRARPYDPADPDPAAQAERFGYNCDYTTLIRSGRGRGWLVVNHEYTNEELMYPGWSGPAAATDAQLRTSQLAHGMSVVEVRRTGRGRWEYDRRGRDNRRITADTPFRLTGPAVGADALRTTADPAGRVVLGTLNNCAGGTTPWGTVLSGEENFNGYFGGLPAGATPDYSGVPASAAVKAGYARYGVGSPTGSEFWRNWEQVDPRFDLTKEPNEPHRFGWVVEVDPSNPESTPRKHTALGRVKHEGATVHIAPSGHVVVYTGDDERFDYLYKFVSKRRYRPGRRRHNLKLLTEGDLYVARFTGDSPAAEIDGTGRLPADGEFDGTGQWLPLVVGGASRVPGMSVAEVLIWTRLAADIAGATKMDRPEDVERNPATGRVYVACTNNNRRTVAQVDEANPRPDNRQGHVIEFEDGDGGTGTGFSWRVFLLCGTPADPTSYFAGFDKSQVSPISSPDNVTFDTTGNLWLATDGAPSGIGFNDALHAVPTVGTDRGHLRQFASVPRGAECCGPLIGPGDRSAFVAVQHPGEGSTFAAPSSRYPYVEAHGVPVRPGVAVIWRPDGRRIGT